MLNIASNTVVADIQELSPTVQTLHWVAPLSYLGNRVSKKKRDYKGNAVVKKCLLIFKSQIKANLKRKLIIFLAHIIYSLFPSVPYLLMNIIIEF